MPMDSEELFKILEDNLSNTDDVYIGKNQNEEEYIKNNIHSIMEAKCGPFKIKATIMEPGFPGKEIGGEVEGYCLAHSNGYWLIYQPEEKTFYCFWGSSKENLGAHGVYGDALYCWTA